MGSELQGKYQKLAQEYAKLRAHVDVLKKAVRDEQGQRATLEASLREKTQSLRKHMQENESLEFRNQQLSKRVALLQDELNNPSKNKKKRGSDSLPSGVSDIHAQELAAKITENENLHMKVLEVTQKSERAISGLESKITRLEQEASMYTAAMDEVKREYDGMLVGLRTEKALLEGKLAKQKSELEALRKDSERQQLTAGNEEQALSGTSSPGQAMLLTTSGGTSFAALNVPVVDTKLQAEVLQSLQGGLDLVATFSTQISTFHSYLEQRCKAYPMDVASGLHMSVVNQKLCELLHSSSSFTRPLVSTLTHYCEKLERNPYSQTSSSDLEDFASAHHKFVVYLETLTPYLQLSLQEECSETVCGAQLTESNMRLSQTLPMLPGLLSSVDDYLSLIATGPSGDLPPCNMPAYLERLQSSFRDVQHTLNEICNHFSSKIALEYQLPTATQKLNTTNECIVSSLTGMIATAEQLSGYLENNQEVFNGALQQNATGTETKKSSSSSVVQRLRMRATNYIQKLQRECPESVPYTLAMYNAKSLSSSSEGKETLLRQMASTQEKLSRLEQDNEQLILDLQLLRVKHEKEQKKVAALEVDLAQLQGRPISPLPSQSSMSSSRTSLHSNPPQPQPLSGSVGSLTALSAEGPEEEASDDAMREEFIRKHFTARIAELGTQLQEADGKSGHFYAECRALYKQLNHSATIRSKLTLDLQTANENIQQLQDQLATTSSNYEKQLSTMSDHLCELNDKLLKQSDQLEELKRTKGKRWGK